jgi:hypothetical protein
VDPSFGNCLSSVVGKAFGNSLVDRVNDPVLKR